jgi:hypothetical protein
LILSTKIKIETPILVFRPEQRSRHGKGNLQLSPVRIGIEINKNQLQAFRRLQ